jgi:hypothetical protein
MAAKDTAPLWSLTDHVCRICFSRVLTRTTFDNRKLFKCSNCETEVEDQHVTGLCCCGMKLRNKRDAGVRCVVNQERRPECPSYIVAIQAELPK